MRQSCVALLVVSFCVVFGNIPFVIDTPSYTAHFNENIPRAKLYANSLDDPFHILSIFPASFREVQLPDGVFNMSLTGSQMTKLVLSKSLIITSYNVSDINFTNTIINEVNRIGMEFNGTFENGAMVSIVYTINREGPLELLIPRVPGDDNCTKQISRYETNCTCEKYRSLDKDSVEFSIVISNWPFAALSGGNKLKRIIMDLELTGDYDLAYYLKFADIGELVSFETCDVGRIEFRLTDVESLPFYFFSNTYNDDKVRTLRTVFDRSALKSVDEGIIFPLGIIFDSFNDSLRYDPDFSILLHNKDDSKNDDDLGDVESEESLDDNTNAILIGVLVPAGILLIIVAVVISISVSIVKRRKLKEMFSSPE